MIETKEESLPTPSGSVKVGSSFVGDVSKLVGGTAFAQALSILMAPILTRLYAPVAFGTAAVFFSITEIIAVVACLRYELVIMLPERDEDAANVLAVSIGSTLAIAGLTAVLIFLGAEPVLRLVNTPDLAPYLWLVPLTILAHGVFLAFSYWNSRARRFWRQSTARVCQSATTNIGQLATGVIGPAEAGGLIGARVLGIALGSAVLAGRIWRDDRALFGGTVSLHRMYSMALRFKKFPLIEMWGALLNNATLYLPVLLLSTFFTKSIVGYFDLSNRLLNLPMNLIGLAIGQVFYQRASLVRSIEDDLVVVVENVYRRLVNIGLFPVILLTLMGKDLAVLFLGQQWGEAGVYIQILSPWLFFRLIFVPMSTLFAVQERLESTLVMHTVVFLSRLLPLIVGGLVGNARIALALYSITGVFVYGGLTLWTLTLAKIPKARGISILLQTLWIYLPLAATLAALKLLFDPSRPVILILSLLGLGGYMALISRTDPTLRHFIIKLYSRLSPRQRFPRS
jgi:O-antigen/teichoic acid export membrane protein